MYIRSHSVDGLKEALDLKNLIRENSCNVDRASQIGGKNDNWRRYSNEEDPSIFWGMMRI